MKSMTAGAIRQLITAMPGTSSPPNLTIIPTNRTSPNMENHKIVSRAGRLRAYRNLKNIEPIMYSFRKRIGTNFPRSIVADPASSG